MEKGKNSKYLELYSQIRSSGSAFIESYRTTSQEPLKASSNIIICGMGGSGISGNYIKILAKTSPRRIIINKDYQLPEEIDNSWSAIVVSYSGNTEETLSCFDELVSLGIQPVCISSNGKLLNLCKNQDLRFVLVPTGIQPRAAFPYLFGALFGLLADSLNLKIPTLKSEERIKKTSDELDHQNLVAIAKKIVGKFPIIVNSAQLSCVGLRFRCQLNENSKMAAANYVSPEFSHNGIVGFDGLTTVNQALILLRTKREHDRTSLHLDYLEHEINTESPILSFREDKPTMLEEIMGLTWKLDYLSVLIAELQEVNPIEVPSIDKLKEKLRSQ